MAPTIITVLSLPQARCIQNSETAKISLKNSPTIIVRKIMYNLSANQKEQLLLKILTTLEASRNSCKNDSESFLMKMYLKVQNLHIGASLEPAEAAKLKKAFKAQRKTHR